MRSYNWLLVICLLAMTVLLLPVCDDDDDDNDPDDFDPGDLNDDDQTGGDDDQADEGDCESFAEDFYGPSGCFPDDEAYQSTMELCQTLESMNNDEVENAFECLGQIDCDSYDDPLDLQAEISACLEDVLP